MSTKTSGPQSAAQAKWLVPILCLGFGLTYLAIGIARHEWGFAIGGLVVMLAYGAVLLIFGRRHETIGLLGGDLGDERRIGLQQRSAASTGYVLTVALVAAMLWSLITDSQYSGVFSGLCGLAGATWIISVIWFSRRG